MHWPPWSVCYIFVLLPLFQSTFFFPSIPKFIFTGRGFIAPRSLFYCTVSIPFAPLLSIELHLVHHTCDCASRCFIAPFSPKRGHVTWVVMVIGISSRAACSPPHCTHVVGRPLTPQWQSQLVVQGFDSGDHVCSVSIETGESARFRPTSTAVIHFASAL